MKKQQHGFIALFFILGLSFTLLTWISLSSERVFQYVRMREDFVKNRSIAYNDILCADAFVDIVIGSRHNIAFEGGLYQFPRNLYFADDFECSIKSIRMTYQEYAIDSVFFIIGDFAFEYKFKNGFVDSIKSFNLF